MSTLFGRLSASLEPSSLAAVFASVAGAVIAHAILRQLVARAARQGTPGAADAGARHWPWWLVRGLPQVLPPVVALIWIHAVYAAARLILADLLGASGEVLGWIYRVGLIAALVWLLHTMGRLAETFCGSLAARADTSWDDLLLPLVGKALRRALPLVAVILGVPALSAHTALASFVSQATSLVLIAMVALMLSELVQAVAAYVLARHRIDVTDNLQARAVYTQVVVLKKVALTIIGIFTLASMLMVFDSVRQFGASILASAGIAGIVVGFAAQRSLSTLLAGFQIAITQPIRVDDVVIVENEWGRVEEITLTYVVVRIWDERRLIVPINLFIEQPFQNWTRSSSELLASVFLHGDYTLPIDSLRAELTRVLQASPLWDGRVNVLQVTAAKEHTIEVRALASAANSSKAWDLRCEVREKLVTFLQQHHPESLPRLRTAFVGADDRAVSMAPEREKGVGSIV